MSSALLALVLLAAPSGQGVVVLSLDPDSARAADSGQELEAQLKAVGLTVLDPSPTAWSSPVAPPPPLDPVAAARAASLREEASNAYSEAAFARSIDRLSALETLLGATRGFPDSARISMRLWKTASFLALKDQAEADREAERALELDPTLQVDLQVFPPSVKQEVDSVRATKGRLVTVELKDLPAGAQVSVDGRQVAPRFQVFVGSHSIRVDAPRHRSLKRALEIAGDLALSSFAPPIELDPAVEAMLTAAAWRGDAPPEDRRRASSLAHRVGAEDLLVFSRNADGAARAVLVPQDPERPILAPPQGLPPAGLARWTRTALKTPEAPAEDSRPGVTAAARMVFAYDTRTLSDGSGVNLPAYLAGGGPEVLINARGGVLFASLEARLISFGFSQVVDSPPGGPSQTVGGGSTLGAALRVGGGKDLGPVRVDLSLGGLYESHQAQDLQGGGQPSGLLDSYTWTGGELAVAATRRMPRVDLSAGVGFIPVSTWTESPAGTSGASPRVQPALSWQIGALVRPAGRWNLSFGYQGLWRQVDFSGTSPSNLQDARIQETVHELSLGVRWRSGL